jgi:hypothetical protein
MIHRMATVGSLMFLLAAAAPASAVTAGPHSKALAPITTGESLLQPVQWGYCARWRRVCAERWGWNTRRFYYCLERYGCNFPF